MHFPTLTLVLLTTSLQTLATPLTFTDIERRWSAGESDASIHSHQNPRSASPTWPLALSSHSQQQQQQQQQHFAESYDAVTQQKTSQLARIRNLNKHHTSKRSSTSSSAALMARIRDFATRLLRSKGEREMIAERRGVDGDGDVEEEEEAPVLRPMKVKYRFTA